MKSIYVFLARSTTVISRVINRFTGDPFTHASIAFEDDLKVMYSFARKYPSLPLPAGLMEEGINRGFFKAQRDIPCALLRVDVPDKVYYRARKRIYRMLRRRDQYTYSILGLFLCSLNIPAVFPGRFFCSQFVATVLTECGAVKLPKPAPLMHPSDFFYMPCFHVVYHGTLYGLRRQQNAGYLPSPAGIMA